MAKLGMRKPFNKSTGRDYRGEYDRYQGQPDQLINRAKRNGARATMAKAGKVSTGDGNDVDHKKAMKNGGTSASSNLRVLPKGKNRGFPRDAKNKPIGSA